MHFDVSTRGGFESNEVHRMNLCSLMQKLVKSVLTIGSWLTPNNCTCIPGYRIPVSTHKLPVALHVRLLEICRKPTQILCVGQNCMGAKAQAVLIPMSQKRQQDRYVVLQICTSEVIVNHPRSGKEFLESIGTNGHSDAQSNWPPHGISPPYPIFKTKSLVVVNAKTPCRIQIGRHRGQLSGRLTSSLNKPVLGNSGVGHGFLCSECFAHHHQHGRLRVQ